MERLRNVAVLGFASLLIVGALTLTAWAQPSGVGGGFTDIVETYFNGSGVPAGNIDMQGNLITDSTGPVQHGTAAVTSHSLAADDDLFGGKVEINGLLYADGAIVASSSLDVGGNASFLYGANAGFYRGYQDGVRMYVDEASTYRNLILTSKANRTKDHDHTASTDPTLFIHSDEDPDTNNAEWLSLSHDQSNGVIATGQGALALEPTAASVILPQIINTNPTEPHTCDATHAGAMTYVDDSDDAAAAEICKCMGVDSTPTYDWVKDDVAFTACTFF